MWTKNSHIPRYFSPLVLALEHCTDRWIGARQTRLQFQNHFFRLGRTKNRFAKKLCAKFLIHPIGLRIFENEKIQKC